jgi:hypothetical protein
VLYNSNYLDSPTYSYTAPQGGFCITPNETSSAGRFRFSIACSPGWNVGSNTIATISFRAKASGTSNLSFGQTVIAGGSGNFTITSTGTSNITVQGATTAPPATGGTTTTPPPTTTPKTQPKTTTNPTTPTTPSTTEAPTQQSVTEETNGTSSSTGTGATATKTVEESGNIFTNLLGGLNDYNEEITQQIIVRLVFITSIIVLAITTMAFSVYFVWGRKV